MSKVTGTTIGGGLISSDQKINRRFFSKQLGNVTKKRLLYRRGELKTLPTLSNIPEAADAWNLLTADEKDYWEIAAEQCGLSNYNLFIQDKINRIINSIPGNADPSPYHQSLVMKITVAPSTGHFLLRSITSETISLPATLKISSKTSLENDGIGSSYLLARFRYFYDVGGTIFNQTDEIDLPLSELWYPRNIPITQQTGAVGHCELEIEGDYVKGQILIDNFYVQDNSGILTNDPYFSNSDIKFYTLIGPSGIIIERIYPPDDI